MYRRVPGSRRAWLLPAALVIAGCLALVMPALGVPMFSGQVLRGTGGVGGAGVTLYCSNNAGNTGQFVSMASTGPGGGFTLEGTDSCEFSNIVLTVPAGSQAESAQSTGGTVKSPIQIQYTLPLAGKALGGNIFRLQQAGGGTNGPVMTGTIPPAGNQPPVARIVINPPSGTAPLAVECSGRDSSDPDGRITAFAWEFGDGTSGSGEVTRHEFLRPGTYLVVLTVTDNAGAVAAARQEVSVREAGPVQPTVQPGNVALVDLTVESPGPGPNDRVMIRAWYNRDVPDPLLAIQVNGNDVKTCQARVCEFSGGPFPGGVDVVVRYHDEGGTIQVKPPGPNKYPTVAGTIATKGPAFGNPNDCDVKEKKQISPELPSMTLCYGDGVPDAIDNCPTTINPDQKDTDQNGVGDMCQDPCTMSISAVKRFSWTDWRGKNWLTPVKDQGSCGSCYAFAGVGGVEGVCSIKADTTTMPDYILSEQWFVSGGFGGCNGGFEDQILADIQKNGAVTETCFPYKSGSCYTRALLSPSQFAALKKTNISYVSYSYNSTTQIYDVTYCVEACSGNAQCANPASRTTSCAQSITIKAYHKVSPDKNSVKQALLCHGPLVVGSNAQAHAFVVVGFNDSMTFPDWNTTGGWVRKNSWGLGYGTKGYGNLPYDHPFTDFVNDAYWVELS